MRTAFAFALPLVFALGLVFWFLSGNRSLPAAQDHSVVAFVGSETCAGCHQTEAKLWNASQHKLAMQHATDKTVLGNFNDASFDHFGVHSRFFRKDGKFLVETDGPDGQLAVYEVKYTFGVEPLQQYLVEFPDGRVQALSIAYVTPASFSGVFRSFTREYIAENRGRGTGWRGVRPFGSQAMRHIVAAATWKRTKDEHAMALAIHDSVTTARKYYHKYYMGTEDRAEVIRGTMQTGAGPFDWSCFDAVLPHVPSPPTAPTSKLVRA